MWDLASQSTLGRPWMPAAAVLKAPRPGSGDDPLGSYHVYLARHPPIIAGRDSSLGLQNVCGLRGGRSAQ